MSFLLHAARSRQGASQVGLVIEVSESNPCRFVLKTEHCVTFPADLSSSIIEFDVVVE